MLTLATDFMIFELFRKMFSQLKQDLDENSVKYFLCTTDRKDSSSSTQSEMFLQAVELLPAHDNNYLMLISKRGLSPSKELKSYKVPLAASHPTTG